MVTIRGVLFRDGRARGVREAAFHRLEAQGSDMEPGITTPEAERFPRRLHTDKGHWHFGSWAE